MFIFDLKNNVFTNIEILKKIKKRIIN